MRTLADDAFTVLLLYLIVMIDAPEKNFRGKEEKTLKKFIFINRGGHGNGKKVECFSNFKYKLELCLTP